jgi:4-amino-4-deoxy-L-arabinose transferase-like glycosyltransferase
LSTASPDELTSPLVAAPESRSAESDSGVTWRAAVSSRLRQNATGRVRPLDLVVLGAVVGIAAAARWPSLWLIPTFTDETLEVRLALQILRGETLPLTNVDPYIGAFWNYVLAAAFGLLGPSPYLPRLLVFVTGVATVGAAWWLGRELGGRLGGLVAGLFMAGCSTHALVNSHVAWSHATTPLWTTLGLAFLARALYEETGDRRQETGEVLGDRLQGTGASSPSPATPSTGPLGCAGSPCHRERGLGGEGTSRGLGGEGNPRGWPLVGAGFFLGLAVQTHVTAALVLPGAALAVLIQRPALLRSRWAIFGALAFLLATANLLVYNVATAGGSLRGGQAVLSDYTGQDDPSDGRNYGENVGRLTLATSWVLSGAIEKRRFVGESLADPLLLGYLGLAIGGVAWAAWRGRWLPVLVIVPYLAILPWLQPKYEPILNGRYVVPVLPLVFGAIGLVVADVWGAIWRRWPTRASLVTGALLAGVAMAALYPLAPMVEYERSARTNDPVFVAYQTIVAARQPDETVLLDYGLDGVFFMAAGSAYKSMELLLGTSNVPWQVVDARASSIEDALAGYDSRLLVLNSDKVSPLSRAFTLTPLMGGGRGGPGFGVYRVSPRRS